MSNRTWIYEYAGGERGEEYCSETITDKEILEDRWEYWKERMIQKYGAESKLITEENCIQDWVTTHWAWELKNQKDTK